MLLQLVLSSGQELKYVPTFVIYVITLLCQFFILTTFLNSEMNALCFFLTQVKVADRTAVVTANAETVVVRPLGLQEAIDAETGIFFTIPLFVFIAMLDLPLQFTNLLR